MTPEDLEAVDQLEKQSDRIAGHYPRISAGIKWLAALAKRQDAPEAVKDERGAILVAQAARIAELESRLGLTPDRVLALERAEFKARMEADERAAEESGEKPRPRPRPAHTPSGRALREAARAKQAAEAPAVAEPVAEPAEGLIPR